MLVSYENELFVLRNNIFRTLVGLLYKLINRSMAHNKHGSNSPFHSKHLYIGSPMIHAL